MATTLDSPSGPALEPETIGAELSPDRDHDEEGPIIPPVTEVTDESLSAPVVQPQADEFVCTSCFLVHHHTRRGPGGEDLCRDCT